MWISIECPETPFVELALRAASSSGATQEGAEVVMGGRCPSDADEAVDDRLLMRCSAMLSSLDVVIVAFCAAALLALAQWVSRETLGHSKDATDYFSRKTTVTGTLLVAVGSAVVVLAIKLLAPTLPFIDHVALVFVLCLVIAGVWSLAKPQPQPDFTELTEVGIVTTTALDAVGIVVSCLCAFFYITWW